MKEEKVARRKKETVENKKSWKEKKQGKDLENVKKEKWRKE